MGAQIVVNYTAVLVAAVVAFIIGGIWYGPLFGKLWMKLAFTSKKDMKKMGMGSAKKSMTIGFLVTVLTAYVLAYFVNYVQATTISGGIGLAFWLWLGIAGPVQIGSVLWEGKSWKLFWLTSAHEFVSLAVMASILAVW